MSESYWDIEATGHTDGISDNVGYRTDFAGLSTDEMQGGVAEENMPALNFEDTWTVVTDPDDYLILRWQVAVDAD
ncbi:hypothetical protein [Natrinema amylolyticum]|uniref:hypothetical protein n=1 Tax=Natrinema amylolyticum TaxID=2878679 RepID=UPI001CFBE56B|nr:hypothetical protein [Natrinema amylolyticum]